MKRNLRDNGFEFAKHEPIATVLKAKTYFYNPYKSYQKGNIEIGNKRLHKWLPSEITIDATGQQKINRYVNLINQRSMKCLGYKTPHEILKNKSTN